jgi:hypothetical protein
MVIDAPVAENVFEKVFVPLKAFVLVFVGKAVICVWTLDVKVDK